MISLVSTWNCERGRERERESEDGRKIRQREEKQGGERKSRHV